MDTAYTVRLADGSEFGPAPIEMIRQWAMEGRVPPDASLVSQDGGPPRPAASVPELAAIIQAPPTVAPPPAPSAAGSGGEGGMTALIPYRNPPALIAYYLGIFSFIPVAGIVLAIPALILGIVGLRKRTTNPQLKGAAHAWIGIVLGALFSLIWGIAIVAIVAARM